MVSNLVEAAQNFGLCLLKEEVSSELRSELERDASVYARQYLGLLRLDLRNFFLTVIGSRMDFASRDGSKCYTFLRANGVDNFGALQEAIKESELIGNRVTAYFAEPYRMAGFVWERTSVDEGAQR